MEIKDDYAVGPLGDIYSEQGIEQRSAWWHEVLAGGEYDGPAGEGSVNDPQTVRKLIAALEQDPQETAWVWVAQNKHDVSGYYWLVSQLPVFQGRVLVLFLHNLPFISLKGTLFYPVNLFQIPPREF